MSIFTEQDVMQMAAGGNIACNTIYMAKHQSTEYSLPTGNNVAKLREFIKKKYVEMEWHRDKIVADFPVPTSLYSYKANKDPWATVRATSAKFDSTIKVHFISYVFHYIRDICLSENSKHED